MGTTHKNSSFLRFFVFFLIFSRQLPQEAKLFAQVDKNWRDIMRRTIDKPNALTAGTVSGLLEILQGCNSTLEKIHHSLEVRIILFPIREYIFFLCNDP